jgi:glycosyltransferase involved in cell wall biosynthesis
MASFWSINGRFVAQPRSGVQRYAYEIIQELDNFVTEEHELVRNVAFELLVPPQAETVNLPQLRSIPIRTAGRRTGHFWEQTDVPFKAKDGLISLCNTGPIFHSRQIVCLHDMNTRVFPESYSFAFRSLYRVLFPALGRRAKLVTTVSHASASQLLHYGIADEDKIRVMPNGHEHAMRWRPQHSPKTQSAADRNTIFVLGSPAPHKNIGLLLSMAGELETAGLRLAIAGMSDARVFKGPVTEGSHKNVIWLGRISDDEIAALFRDCLCLAFPSFAEGFGLPAIEAMVWQCPVVASDRTSLPEICGGAALYAPPDDPGAWKNQIMRLARDEALRRELVEKGKAQMRKFSWRESARLYLQAIKELG